MNVIDFLSTDGYITVNKKVIRLIGLEEAIILGELCSEYIYWRDKNELEDDMFYCTVENMEENTGLSIHKQRKAINKLESLGVISTIKKGLPAKRYIRINIAKLCEVLEYEELHNKTNNGLLSSELKINALDNENFTLNNNKKIIINNKNNISIKNTNSKKLVKKKSLYEKMHDEILLFTKDTKIQDALIQFLNLQLEIYKEQGKVYYSNIFKSRLKKLKTDFDKKDWLNIIQTATERGWQNFYPVQDYDKPSKKKKSYDTGVSCEKYTEEEMKEIRKWQKEMEAKGEKMVF